jgi:hypothetical protein
MAQKILNPKTNRFVNIGTQKYKRLVAEGVLKHAEPNFSDADQKTLPTPNYSDADQKILPAPEPTPDFKIKLMEVSTDLVKDNIKQFTPELSQAQTDRLLKQMLYKKLCLNEKVKKPKSKDLKKKKKQYKVVAPPNTSSDSESDSD